MRELPCATFGNGVRTVRRRQMPERTRQHGNRLLGKTNYSARVGNRLHLHSVWPAEPFATCIGIVFARKPAREIYPQSQETSYADMVMGLRRAVPAGPGGE